MLCMLFTLFISLSLALTHTLSHSLTLRLPLLLLCRMRSRVVKQNSECSLLRFCHLLVEVKRKEGKWDNMSWFFSYVYIICLSPWHAFLSLSLSLFFATLSTDASTWRELHQNAFDRICLHFKPEFVQPTKTLESMVTFSWCLLSFFFMHAYVHIMCDHYFYRLLFCCIGNYMLWDAYLLLCSRYLLLLSLCRVFVLFFTFLSSLNEWRFLNPFHWLIL